MELLTVSLLIIVSVIVYKWFSGMFKSPKSTMSRVSTELGDYAVTGLYKANLGQLAEITDEYGTRIDDLEALRVKILKGGAE
jgi:hypothetical protein